MEDAAPEVAADRITSQVVKLGQRYYPSEFAFPLRTSFRSWNVHCHSP